jgi:saccharopine dehydrogenase-like NADP-dependent oxidoreductase
VRNSWASAWAFRSTTSAPATPRGSNGAVRAMDYTTVRDPGHCELMKVLLEDLWLKSKRDMIVSILREAIPSTEHDVVVVFASATGEHRLRHIHEEPNHGAVPQRAPDPG